MNTRFHTETQNRFTEANQGREDPNRRAAQTSRERAPGQAPSGHPLRCLRSLLFHSLLAAALVLLPAVVHVQGGVAVWTNYFTGGDDAASTRDIAVDPNSGNVIVTGTVWTQETQDDCLTIAYSSAGVDLWTNIYRSPYNRNDRGRAVAVDPRNGDVVVTGDAYLAGYSRVATIKYSSAGVLLWTNLSFNNESGYRVAVDTNGSVFVVTMTNLIKYSSAGAVLWTRQHGALSLPMSLHNSPVMALDSSGNVVVVGNPTKGWIYKTTKYSNASVPLWTNYHNNQFAQAVAVHPPQRRCVCDRYRLWLRPDDDHQVFERGSAPLDQLLLRGR